MSIIYLFEYVLKTKTDLIWESCKTGNMRYIYIFEKHLINSSTSRELKSLSYVSLNSKITFEESI